MSKLKYYFIHITLLSTVILWFLSLMVLAFYLDGGTPKSDVFHIVLVIFIILTVMTAVGMTLSFVTKTGKEYWRKYEKGEYRKHLFKLKNQHLEELKDKDYNMLKEYHGKNTFPVHSAVTVWVVVFIHIALSVIMEYVCITQDDSYVMGLVMWFIPISVFVVIWIISHQSKRARIDETGVHLCNGKEVIRTIKWEKIKSIGISTNTFGYRTRFGYIYYSTRKIDKDICINEYKEKNGRILIKPKPKIIHCTLKYWHGEIQNLDTQKNWLRYVNKL